MDGDDRLTQVAEPWTNEPWVIDILHLATLPGLPLRDFLRDAPPDMTIDVPCYGYLLTCAGATILVDSGPDIANPRAIQSGVIGDPQGVLQRSLEYRGRSGEDVDLIIHTHLHYDHMQNDLDFRESLVVVQESEVQFALLREPEDFYIGVSEYVDHLGQRLSQVSGEFTLVPGVRLIPTGGHSPGHQAVLVDSVWGPVCIAGDVISLTENLVRRSPACPDEEGTLRFLRRVEAEAWRVLPGHEPAFRSVDDLSALWGPVARTGSIAR